MPGSRKPSYRKKHYTAVPGLVRFLKILAGFDSVPLDPSAVPGLSLSFFCFSIDQAEIPCVREEIFNKRSGGRISDLYILPSRILKKNRRMADRVQSIQDGAEQREGDV